MILTQNNASVFIYFNTLNEKTLKNGNKKNHLRNLNDKKQKC